MKEYLIIYLVIGLIVATSIYGGSIFYKLKHKEYINNNSNKWGMSLGFIVIPLLWIPFLCVVGYGVVNDNHRRLQTLTIINKLEKELKSNE